MLFAGGTLVAPDKALADRIIFATNNQNKVDPASLRATDKVQRDIEDLLLRSNWFYDRRKQYYANHGKPAARIVSMTYMASVMLALRLGAPSKAGRSRPRYMLSDSAYRQIFGEERDVKTYLAALEMCKRVEQLMAELAVTIDPYDTRNFTMLYRFLYAHLACLATLGRPVRSDHDVLEFATTSALKETVADVHALVTDARKQFLRRHRARRLHRSTEFQDYVAATVLSWVEGGRPNLGR